MLRTNEKGILSLINSALCGKKINLPLEFSLSEALPIILNHGIANICYYGAVNCGIDKKDPAMQKLFAVSVNYMAQNERKLKVLDEIYKAFNKTGISYMALKGAALQKIYPKSNMRALGDIDLLIDPKQYDLIKSEIIKLGFTEQNESDHEYIWTNPVCVLEFHKYLIPSYHTELHNYFGEGFFRATKSGSEYVLSKEDNFLYLLGHFAKHYRGGGIGLRHFLDLYVYKMHYKDLDENYILAETEKMGIREFYINLQKTFKACFLNAEFSPVSISIVEYVFNSGKFGTKESIATANAMRDGKTKAGSILSTIFLSYDRMVIKYRFLKKLPFLLPVMWIYRIITLPFKGKKHINNITNSVNAYTDEDINNLKEHLRSVGL